jgi:hypothetical protein
MIMEKAQAVSAACLELAPEIAMEHRVDAATLKIESVKELDGQWYYEFNGEYFALWEPLARRIAFPYWTKGFKYNFSGVGLLERVIRKIGTRAYRLPPDKLKDWMHSRPSKKVMNSPTMNDEGDNGAIVNIARYCAAVLCKSEDCSGFPDSILEDLEAAKGKKSIRGKNLDKAIAYENANHRLHYWTMHDATQGNFKAWLANAIRGSSINKSISNMRLCLPIRFADYGGERAIIRQTALCHCDLCKPANDRLFEVGQQISRNRRAPILAIKRNTGKNRSVDFENRCPSDRNRLAELVEKPEKYALMSSLYCEEHFLMECGFCHRLFLLSDEMLLQNQSYWQERVLRSKFSNEHLTVPKWAKNSGLAFFGRPTTNSTPSKIERERKRDEQMSKTQRVKKLLDDEGVGKPVQWTSQISCFNPNCKSHETDDLPEFSPWVFRGVRWNYVRQSAEDVSSWAKSTAVVASTDEVLSQETRKAISNEFARTVPGTNKHKFLGLLLDHLLVNDAVREVYSFLGSLPADERRQLLQFFLQLQRGKGHGDR